MCPGNDYHQSQPIQTHLSLSHLSFITSKCSTSQVFILGHQTRVRVIKDLMLGFGIEDAFQMARLKILDELKRYDIGRSNFPSFKVINPYRACSRLVRYARAQKRDYTRKAELDTAEYREEVA